MFEKSFLQSAGSILQKAFSGCTPETAVGSISFWTALRQKGEPAYGLF